MTRWLVDASAHLDRCWVWFYTAGVAQDTAARRREELDSDQWEMTNLARRGRWSDGELGAQRTLRWLLGLPADVTWRVGLGRQGFARESLTDLVAAGLLTGGLAVSLPLSMLLMLAGNTFDGHGGSQVLLLFAMTVVLLLCVGGVAVQELRPAAGTLVALTGVLSLSLVLWWTITIPVLGALCAAGIIFRAHRLKH